MAFTAYPDDVGENPNIVASNNGIDWVVPPGLTNPIDPLPGDKPMVNGSRFNADTDLVHHDGTLYAFWRLYDSQGTDGFKFRVWMRSSTDGVTWTPRQVVIEAMDDSFTSPFILVDQDGTWSMWYGARPGGGATVVRRRTAPSPTGPWSAPTDCTIVGLESWRHMWHFDAVQHDGMYLGLFTSTQLGTTNLHGVLYLAVSLDGIRWAVGDAVVAATKPAPGIPQRWDSSIIYRCSGVVDGDILRTWYATASRIGYTEIPWKQHIKSGLDLLRHA